MNRGVTFLTTIVLILFFGLSLVSASIFPITPNDKIHFSQEEYIGSIQNKSAISRNSNFHTAGSSINILPEAGFYYIKDYMTLEAITGSVTSCTYNINGGTFESLERGNSTDHYHYVTNLADNMNGDPYIIDFKCVDGSGGETMAETYFWISHEGLDNYFFRNNIEDWEYFGSNRRWKGNSNGLLETYDAYYDINGNSMETLTEIMLFDSEDSVNNLINKEMVNDSGWNAGIKVLEGQNVYVFSYLSSKGAAWKSGNKLIFLLTYPYDNTTSVNVQVPLSIIKQYIARYPGDVRNGICGDGKVDIFNLNGQKEECDNNSQAIDCGSSVGECKIGKKLRKCKADCIWGDYEACNSTTPKPEKCDGKDNDCNGVIDNGFSSIGKSCTVGIGECNQTGAYVCSPNGATTQCNAVAKTPQKANCLNGKDNDCDGIIDSKDVNDCMPLKILSPLNGFNYSNKNVLLSMIVGNYSDELSYSFNDTKGKETKVRLCTKCSSYNRTVSFKDGFYNLKFAAWANKTVIDNKPVRFLVDSTAPKILDTEPKRDFTNGIFDIQFTEDNPKSLVLHYNVSQKAIDLKTCNETKGKKYCNIFVNISTFNDRPLSYYFELQDIAGNKVTSKPIVLTGDTIPPKLNSFNWTIKKGTVRFVLNVTEKNFNEISYIDWKDSKPKERVLCSQLRNGICDSSKSFKTGMHNVTIYVSDKVANRVQKSITFTV